ncbi:MAG: hypothetical protein CFE27_10420 [Alphaproteobacteria bacterium PA1]|nr:MAG: hypothetical protein CFE27_10420 [Alphaproteobacteria bacterium PA1]
MEAAAKPVNGNAQLVLRGSFGVHSVTPNRCLNCSCDLWAVKCPFSMKTDRLATQQSCALDDPDVAGMLDHPFW